MADKKSFEVIKKEIEEAQKHIEIGGIYSHYKNPQNTYKVISLCTLEATDTLGVIYQTQYDNGKDLFFVRSLESWIEVVNVDGTSVERFKRVK